MQQLARMTLIKRWGSLLLQELCNLRELGIKTGFVLMMCWCLQENRVFSQLWREASLRKVPSTKLCSLLPNRPPATKSEGSGVQGFGNVQVCISPSSPSLPILTPCMPSREGAGLGHGWSTCRGSWKRLQV